MKLSKRVRVIVTSLAIPLLFLCAFALVIAVYSNFHKTPEVDVAAGGFKPQTIEINEGETIHFVNSSVSSMQTICLGLDKRCDSSVLLPSALKNPGLKIAPDQAKDVVFDTYGIFHITATTAPGLNLTVTVDAAG